MSDTKTKLYETSKFGTDVWNDSCAVAELEYALASNAVGATTNPVIVYNVLKQELAQWEPRLIELIQTCPTATEDEIAWMIIEELAQNGAKMLQPAFERENGLKGRLSIQTNAKYYRTAQAIVDQTLHFGTLAPNIQVKIPVTAAGIEAIEEVTSKGININATVCFTLSQMIAVAEAVERGLARKEANVDPDKMSPVCTIMVGRTDDWMRDVVAEQTIDIDEAYTHWAGIAVAKKAYRIFKERGYRTRVLLAAFRNLNHWAQFIGGDLAMTIPGPWQHKINESDIDVVSRIDDPVDQKIVDTLYDRIPDFRRAYDEDGLTIDEFVQYGATRKTLNSFLEGYTDLVRLIRSYMIP